MKSLKYFINEKSINNEIQQWSEKELKEYIDKHNNDEKISSLLMKKLNLVKKFYKTIKKAKSTQNPSERKKLLSEIKTSNLINHAPKEARDPKGEKLKYYQKNTGVYLWKNGYTPEKFLGAGTHGVVWQCDGKAMKVTCASASEKRTIEKEVKETKALKKIIGDNKSHEKYIVKPNLLFQESNKKAIFESDFANKGTLKNYLEKDQEQNIEEIIRMGKNALKGLNVIHDAGYSHNDIHPENILIIERQSKNLKSCKNILKISDFGAMTKAKKDHKVFGNTIFRAPDSMIIKTEAVEKRDSYSLGAVLLFLMFKGSKKVSDTNSLAKKLVSKKAESFYDSYNLSSIYGEESREKVIKLLKLIEKMVQSSYKNRISIKDALTEIKKIN